VADAERTQREDDWRDNPPGEPHRRPCDGPPLRIEGIEVFELLGEGGFGRVYRGHDGSHEVAVKVPRPDRLSDDLLKRWEDECALSVSLPIDPHRVAVHRVTSGRYGDGRSVAVLVMELLVGAMSLTDFMRTTKCDRAERLDLLAGPIDALVRMHRGGIVHGDLKPANILVVGEPDAPVAKLTDLGAARLVAFVNSDAPMRTRIYAAPEQFLPHGAKIGKRTDVYALGVILWEVLTDADDLIRDWLNLPVERRDPLSLADRIPVADRRLESLINDAIDNDAQARPADAEKFRQRLRAARRRPVTAALLAVGDRLNLPGWTGTIVRAAVILLLAALAVFLAGRQTSEIVRRGGPLRPTIAPMVVGAADLDWVRVARLISDDEYRELLSLNQSHGSPYDLPETVQTNAELRPLWASAIVRLAEAGARGIGLDLVLPAQSAATAPEFLDAVMIDAIDEARRIGPTPVVIAEWSITPIPSHAPHAELDRAIRGAGHIYVLLPKSMNGGIHFLTVDRNGTIRAPFAIWTAMATVLGAGRINVAEAPGARLVVSTDRGEAITIPHFGATVFDSAQTTDNDMRQEYLNAGVRDGDRVLVYHVDMPPREDFEAIEIDLRSVLFGDLGALRRAVRGRVVLLGTNVAYAPGVPPQLFDYIERVTPAQFRAMNDRAPDPSNPDDYPGIWSHAAAIGAILGGTIGPRAPGWSFALPYVIAAAAGLVGAWVVGAIRHGNDKRPPSTTRPHFLAAAWGFWIVVALALALVIPGYGVIAEHWPVAAPFTIATVLWSAFFGLLFGVCLALRAACSRAIQQSHLSGKRTHAW